MKNHLNCLLLLRWSIASVSHIPQCNSCLSRNTPPCNRSMVILLQKGALSDVCMISDSNGGWANIVTTEPMLSQCWANLHYCLGWRGWWNVKVDVLKRYVLTNDRVISVLHCQYLSSQMGASGYWQQLQPQTTNYVWDLAARGNTSVCMHWDIGQHRVILMCECAWLFHCSDVTWASWSLKSGVAQLFVFTHM